MITDQRGVLAEYWNTCEYPTFREYFLAQAETLVFFLREAAEEQWDSLDGATDEENGEKMQRWWNQQLRRFKVRLRLEKVQERTDRLLEKVQERADRLLEREKCRRRQREDQLQAELEATQAELHRAKDDLAVQQVCIDFLKEQWRCRDCNAERFWGDN